MRRPEAAARGGKGRRLTIQAGGFQARAQAHAAFVIAALDICLILVEVDPYNGILVSWSVMHSWAHALCLCCHAVSCPPCTHKCLCCPSDRGVCPGVWSKDTGASDSAGFEAMLDVLGLSGLQRMTARLVEGFELRHVPGESFEVDFLTIVPFFRVSEAVRFNRRVGLCGWCDERAHPPTHPH